MLYRIAPPIGWLLAVSLTCTYGASTLAKSVTDLAKVDFNRDIRPVFSEHCYACHGPDENKRKAGLRLDVAEAAFKELKSGNHALVAGDLARSTLVARVASKDPDEVMPPPKHNKPLKPEQVALLRQWVQEGAQWKKQDFTWKTASSVSLTSLNMRAGGPSSSRNGRSESKR